MWPSEEIPDQSHLFLRVHKNNTKNGTPNAGAFREHGDGDKKGMSTDWEKYSSAAESRNRASSPIDNGIIKLVTGELRSLTLSVLHTPIFDNPKISDNRAHTDVKGIGRDPEIRLKLQDISTNWEIKPLDPLS
jgi:hypothetical protein